MSGLDGFGGNAFPEFLPPAARPASPDAPAADRPGHAAGPVAPAPAATGDQAAFDGPDRLSQAGGADYGDMPWDPASAPAASGVERAKAWGKRLIGGFGQ